jgi:hypothetical protein
MLFNWFGIEGTLYYPSLPAYRRQAEGEPLAVGVDKNMPLSLIHPPLTGYSLQRETKLEKSYDTSFGQINKRGELLGINLLYLKIFISTTEYNNDYTPFI